jgi:hypothetical protein
VLASVIGFGIGLLITGGILLGPTLVNQLAMQQRANGEVASATETVPTTNPTPDITQDVPVTIESPTAESISTDDKATVSGKAPNSSYIIIAGDVDETVVVVNNGAYTGTITLKEGKNDISVTSVGSTQTTSQRTVIYHTP